MANKKYDVVALGELLVDFAQSGYSPQGNLMFHANPGGAPCNVLSMLTGYGKKTAFMGKVGSDFLGLMLKDTLDKLGIDTINLKMDEETPTTLAFVHNKPDGDRDFTFYRKPGADMRYSVSDLDYNLLREAHIFHFGSLSMTDPVVREATIEAVSTAKKSGAVISFDPNLRLPLWESKDLAKEQICYGLSQCDILKISEEELFFSTNKTDVDTAVQMLQNTYDIKLINVTMGGKGSASYYKDICVNQEAYPIGHVIDTTGAGDTFCASVLYYVLENGLEELSMMKLKDMLMLANGAAALITTKIGALCSMPSKEDIMHLLFNKESSIYRYDIKL